MRTVDELIDMCRVEPGKRFRLKNHDPSWAGDPKIPKAERKKFAEEHLTQEVSSLAETQELLYAADTWSVLLIFQAMDAAGKDGTIKHVMSGVNPQGCQVTSFKHPSSEELDHNFLWRCSKALPERGRIGIFNRSYYEEVLIVKVHPELVASQRIPNGRVGKKFWQHRYDDINSFEQHLSRNGTLILKFFLNVSKGEQRKRLLDRVKEPDKHWKLAAGDVRERGFWDDYMEAYEECIDATSTDWAPWHVIPADHKWVSRALVAAIVAQGIRGLDLKFPEITPEKEREIEEVRKLLEGE